MESLAQVDDLRLEWVLDENERRLAEATLEELSDDARFYGSDSWDSEDTAPRQVVSLVMRAAKRFLRNPDGYTQSRAGDETLAWTDLGHDAGSPTFNEREVKMLRALAGRSALTTVEITAWNSRRRPGAEGFVPVVNGEPFPMFSSDTSPW